MKIKIINIQDLKEIAEFKSFYSPQSIEDLVDSYLTYGQQVPIHITEDNEIINGYRMVEAIQVAGDITVIAQIIDGKPDVRKRIALNQYRQKTTADLIRETREIFKMYPKRQGKKAKDGEPYNRSDRISKATNGRWKNDVVQNRLEYVLNNDLEGDVLSNGIIEKGWKVDTCYDYLKNKMAEDIQKGYGYTLGLIKGKFNVSEVNRFITERGILEKKFEPTFVIPEKANNYNMDCVKLSELPQFSKQVALLTTSIPYWDLRYYQNGQDRQLGQEETKEEFALNIAKIFERLTPTLKNTANVVINIGETYKNGVAQGIPFLIRDYIEKHTSLVYKETLIWSKKNPRPQGEKVKRPVNSVEYCFWFVVDPKVAKYNLLTFPVEGKTAKLTGGVKDVGSNGTVPKKRKSVSKTYGKLKSHLKEQEIEKIIVTSIGKNHDIARFSSAGHPAPMSPMLPVTLTLMLSDEHDLVCDPFGGSNVVGKCALELNRRYVGSELSTEYYQIGCEMLNLGDQNFNREELDEINDLVYPNQWANKDFNNAA